MISPAALVADLKKQVLLLEDDLRQRITLPEYDGEWRSEHAAATSGDRTAATYTAWADDRITQAAVSWVLTTVFVRFCEDNALLSPVWISGPAERRQEALDAQLAYFRAHPEHTDREWVEQAIAHLAATPATAGLVDDQAMLHTASPSGQAVTRLLEFWRRRGDDGALVHSFTDPELSTRFLGDLYQDLSEHAKKTYALLQTPEFVEEFILDRTLEPALNDRPLDGFKLIDPACGSGHFLLGAFRRLLARWEKEGPALGARERVQKALDGVWGVDINPFAAAIAVFRLTVAALQAVGHTSLETAPGFTINVLAGDSLWFSRVKEGLFQAQGEFAYSTEHKEALIETLRSGQYDAVVANPPYITVKDKALNAGYRERFTHLKGKYQLTAPFMELLFALAKRGDGAAQAGWVGQITSNAFMKREFGTPMVEDLLAALDLRLVIDTSGAYIPGHGTPTVLLVGRNDSPVLSSVRAVLGVEGEPGRPGKPDDGLVWRSIVRGLDQPGYADRWTNVADLERRSLDRHPWSLSGGGALSLLERLESNPRGRLGAFALRIGIFGVMGSDDSMMLPGHVKGQLRLESAATAPLVLGEAVRDFRVAATTQAWFPYSEQNELLPMDRFPAWAKRLWSTRTELGNRATFSKGTYFTDGRPFYEWHQLPRDNGSHAWTITFAEVATHNHFVLERNRVAIGRTAPVIKLPAGATEGDHLELLGVLNSSTACFWLKQKCYPKGGDPVGQDGARVSQQPWSDRYQFNGANVQDFPLPKTLPLDRGRVLDDLAQELSRNQVEALIASNSPTADLLGEAGAAQSSLRGRMIAHQEELDWEVYASYGLLDEAIVYAGEPPEVRLGERAFEIVLARRIAAGEDETTWFSRHGSTPITEIPGHWPAAYRDLVQRRIDAIEQVDAIRLLETPEYKRRWATEPFAKQADRALRGWLLDRLEERSLWFTSQGQVRPQSVGQLADALGRDAEFVSVVDLWQGRRDADLVAALTSLVESEAVPYLAAYRLKDSGLRKFAEWQRTWELQRREDAGESVGAIPVPPKYSTADFRKTAYWSDRGKLDVPKERFILYPGAGRETDPTPLLGWAGWDHAQQSLALATILAERTAEGVDDAALVPLVAGLAEVQPWVEQWHSAIDPTFGVSPAQFSGEQLRDHLASLGLTVDDLAAWRPAAATRGRRATSGNEREGAR
ncbi:BREX-2 system adenine-specific DNA-methyltransferase PglX [Tessaracoccus sp. MC1679]|uniref:BREX-2 system adenine-specific DNA-methyltransferase PglX n=1 Tax=Tessaracoccus sp. MC1679 TaxID=2760313 RepID=UPI001C7262F7